jgi:nucleotide-binding universal stress UspA family protein
MSVLVGYIPTPEGRTAFDRAVDEAVLRGSRLIVLNASAGLSYVDPALASDEELAEVDKRLTAVGVDHEIRQQVGREPVDALLDAAEEDGVELLVIGLRRRSPVGKLFLGSSAQRILLEAERPVLGVKASR